MMKLDLKAPHQKYFATDGKQVCGVTTYLGVLAKDSLVPWAAKMEREGVREFVLSRIEGDTYGDELTCYDVECAFDALPKPYFYAGATTRAADLGTITHARIEAWLHGTTLDEYGIDPTLYEASAAPWERFQEWWDGEGLTLVASEEQLVHPELGYGGTIDFVARDKAGKLVLGDIKTTKANKSWPYPTVIAQVAAYGALWDAHHSEEGKEEWIERTVVVRVGKEASDLGQQVWLDSEQVQAGMYLFLAAKAAWHALKAL